MLEDKSITQDAYFKNHLERIRNATLGKFDLTQIPEWICQNTYIQFKKYSYKNHEYQERILRDISSEVVIKKCSQVGISELSVRKALAIVAIKRGFTLAYTLPTSKFASTFMRTRVDPVIQLSPFLTDMIHRTTDNTEVKRFGESYLYLKGAQSSGAPISIPCDMLIHDEVDFSDPEIISQYHSRLTHSGYKWKTKLSTPTVPDRGIDREFSRSRRHFNFVKCDHCAHFFYPDYFRDVKVPGFNHDLRGINKTNLHKLRYQEAYVACPKCGRNPSLQPEHRTWVCENPDEAHIAVGYQVSPFDAPNIISPAYLIESSTNYKRYVDFVNFNLGMASEDSENAITQQDLDAVLIETLDNAYGSYVMGLDMGMECHCVIAYVTHDGFVIIVHSEVIHASNVKARRKELAAKFRVRMTVVDSLPYTETVLAMQLEDRNLFGAIYSVSKKLETHWVKDQDEDKDSAVTQVRQVTVNKNVALDSFMMLIKGGLIRKVKDKNDDIWIKHLTDMKRMKEGNSDGDLEYRWRKSEEGQDHFHHASLYAWVASQMLGVTRSGLILPPLMGKFRVKS